VLTLALILMVAATGWLWTRARWWQRRRRALQVINRLGPGERPTRQRPVIRAFDDRRYGVALALALEEVARSLRSGTSLLLALEEAASGAPPPLAGDLTMVTEDAAGAGLSTALECWRRRRPRSDVGMAVAALALAAETGGGQARAVDGVAAGLLQRQAVQAELRAAAAQARLSAMVIATAPVGFAVLVSSGTGGPVHVLLGSTSGLALLAAALALDGAGAWWMVRLTRLRR
jgi:tight adherence protein B